MTKPKRPRGAMTLDEHEAWLKETGQYEAFIERQRQRDEEIQRLEEQEARAEAPLVEELRAAGFDVESAWDLVNTPGSYPKAVPILLAHLPRDYPPAIRDGIARALAVPETRITGWEMLLELYAKEPVERVRQGLAVAIANCATDDVIDVVIALARDKKQGPSRGLLLGALERSRDPRARAALMGLGTDPELAEEIQVILRRLKRRTKRK